MARRALFARWPEWLTAIVAVTAGLYVSGSALTRGFPIDDAWIHMVYGAALRDHGMLAYNDGTPATGSTSPLWAVAAALSHAAGAQIPSMRAALCLKGFSCLFHVATSVLAVLLTRVCVARSRGAVWVAFTAGVLTASSPILAFAAMSGMEVSLASALLLGALLAVARGRAVVAGVVLGLAVLARPECVLAVPVTVLLQWLSRRGRARTTSALVTGAIALGIVGAMALRNFLVSSRPLPATFYAKAGLSESVASALVDGVHVLRAAMPVSYAGVLGLAAIALVASARGAWRGRHDRGARVVLRARLVTLATLTIGWAYLLGASLMMRMQLADSFYYQRYLLPPWPLLVVGGVAGVWGLFELPRCAPVTPVVARGVCLAAALAILVPGLYAMPRARAEYAASVLRIDSVQVAVGKFVGATLPADATVWTVDAGAIRYWGRRRTVNLMRLNTPDLVRSGKVRKEWWADAVVFVPRYFRVSAEKGLLDTAFVAHPDDDHEPLERSASSQIVLRCAAAPAEGVENKVVVRAGNQLIAVGRCRQPGS